jgi:acetyl-CoA carboxylase biotin carboxylase subunit
VLVANRGEIAVRIIRSLRRLGLESVLAASSADRDSMAARLADRTLCIGPPAAAESYLRIDTLIEAARGAGVQAIHPGYGFLSERPAFATACEKANLIFIGPTAAQIECVGDKAEARRTAEAALVPVVAGGPVETLPQARALADSIGYPIVIKAASGGAGHAVKRADTRAELESLFAPASAVAFAACGDARVYLECCVAQARHIEVQLLGDGDKVVALGDRDGSVQRRSRKLIEEAPAPCLPDLLRRDLHDAALRFARHIGYRSLGSVEFLVDVTRQRYYFIEMTARVQAAHPVTEQVTGLDLVAEQIAVAQGDLLRIEASDVRIAGHAIECRLHAADPARAFRPMPGRVTAAHFPAGQRLRVDTHIEAGADVPPYYDTLLAKLIVSGDDRDEARRGLAAALAEVRIEGLPTDLALHRRLVSAAEFAAGGMDSGFLGRHLADAGAPGAAP